MSRRKQSNPKPLKSGEEEASWNEEDKSKTSLEEVIKETTTPDNEDTIRTSPTRSTESNVKVNGDDASLQTIKIEPSSSDSETSVVADRVEGSESVIKKANSVESAESGTDAKNVASVVIKNEPVASPVSVVPINEQEYLGVLPQTLQSALTGARYYPTVINAASDARYRTETSLDTRQGFVCPPCNIKFSSLSTLEAHQTYYCSQRQKKQNKGGAESEGEDGRALSVSGGYDQDEGSSGENMSTGEPSTKIAKTGKQYRCTHCSYSADKKVSLNRHMRMHSASPATSVHNDSDSSLQPIDRYCQECDIRFSNLKTFKAHKLHYCSTRNVIKRAPNANSSPSPNLSIDSRITPPLSSFGLANQNPPQPFIALPTNPVLIVPYSLIQAGNMLSSPVTSGLNAQDGVYLLLPDGTIQMVAQSMANQANRTSELSSPVLQPIPTSNNSQQQVTKEAASSKPTKHQAPQPLVNVALANGALDLRMRRESNGSESTTTIDASEEEKENRLLDEQTDHEDIVCAPSIPLILSTSSTCSTPSPIPLSPGSQTRTSSCSEKLCSPSPKSVITIASSKTAKKIANGVIRKCSKSESSVDDKKIDSFAGRDTATAAAAAAVAAERNPNFSLTEMLLAAASQNHSESAKELQFPPEMIPHLSAIQQMNSAKRPALNPIANIPLLLPPVSPGSRVMPEILNPSILPLLTSELAMRLASTNVPAAGIPQYIRQGTWKCEDCNIGFCKYENYVAHKKHYCSTRKVQDSTQSDDSIKTSPAGSPSSKTLAPSPQTISKENTSPVPHPTNVIQSARSFSQFVCQMCGIKFTSLDNLSTHQTFYCPNRATVADGEKSSLKCPKCKVLLPVDQLSTHQCSGTASSGWKCPCCFTICNSTNAIQKHIESHSGVKAFLCTICNYKGNTIRGMRTHIRVHFDKRNGEIMEENYITCLMEENSSAASSSDENSVDKSVKKAIPETTPPPPPIVEEKPPEGRFSPIVVDCVEDEDEYIEVDELPNIKSIGGDSCKESADPIVTKEAETKSSQESADDTTTDSSIKKYGPKYCKSCDISFNYLSTFIAHKKYYCTNSNDASSSLNSAESIVIPTNIAAAAHIV